MRQLPSKFTLTLVKNMNSIAYNNSSRGVFFVEITSEDIDGITELTGKLLYSRNGKAPITVFSTMYNNPSIKNKKQLLYEFNTIFDEDIVKYIISARDYMDSNKEYFSINTLVNKKSRQKKIFNNFEKTLNYYEDCEEVVQD